LISTAADEPADVVEGSTGHYANDCSTGRSIENGGSRMPWYEPRSVMDRPAQRQPSTSPPDTAGGNSQRLIEDSQLRAPSAAPTLLVGEREHRLYVLKAPQVDYVEADGNYVKFHVDAAEYIGRASMRRLSAELANSGFVRIERSLLINVRAIAYAQRSSRGRYAFTLVSGVCVHSSSRYRAEILRVIPLTQGAGARSSSVR
jgi:hypothetical protein